MNRFAQAVMLLLTLCCACLCNAQSGNTISYVYDDLGRLIAVTDPTSDTARYTYDSVGNLISISRYASSQLSVIKFDPSAGVVGSHVTISGTGFSATPSQNAVQFNGVTAAVYSATSTKLDVTVPSGASTGPISVTTGGATVTTADSFVLTALPAITSFSPTIGLPGTSVNITGVNFDATGDTATLNINPATVMSANSTSIVATVPQATTSGHIAISALSGTATSSDYFFIPPPPYAVGDVLYTGQMLIGSASTITLNTSSKIALVVFDGRAGQVLSAEVAGFGGGFFTATILEPDGSTLASALATNIITFTGKGLPVSGTYTVSLAPGTGVTGSATVSLSSQNTNETMSFNTPVTKTISATSQVALNFKGLAGQVVNTEVAGLSGGLFNVAILNPDGSSFVSGNGFGTVSFTGKVLPFTGIYTLLIMPNNGVTGSVTASLTSNLTSDSINFNSAVTKTVSVTAQIGLDFSGTAGQIVDAEIAGLGGGLFTVTLLKPDGSALSTGNGFSTVSFLGKLLPTTGTYQIVITPNNGVTGSATASMTNQTTNDTASFNTPITKTIGVTSLIGLNFSGTAGQVVSVESAGLSGGFWLYLLNPDGTTLGSTNGSGQLYLLGKTLPTTGTYQIVITPNNGVTGSATASLTSQTTNDAGSFSTPIAKTIAVTSLIGLSFSGTAGQAVSVESAGLSGLFGLYLLNPDGTTLGSTNGTAQLSLTGKSLPTTGTYQIVIAPNNGVTGSATVSMTSQATNDTISFNTPSAKTIAVTSLIGLNFSGTAGRIVSVESVGLNGNYSLYVLNPDGSTLGSTFGSNQLTIVGKSLATTGTYQIVIIPNRTVSGSIKVSLISQTTNDTIAFGTQATKSPGANSLVGLSFSGTAGQTASVQVTPSFNSGFFWVYLLNPSGSVLASTFSNGTATFAGKTLATTGTYQIVIIPNSNVTGSATVSLSTP